MTESAAQQLTDELLQRDIGIMRVVDGVEQELEQQVSTLTLLLVGILAQRDPTEPIRTSFQRQRLDRVIRDARPEIRAAYRQGYRNTRGGLIDLASDEIGFFRRLITRVIGVDVVRREINPERIRAIIDTDTMTANFNDADTLRGFFEREAAAHHRRLRGALLDGFANGDNLSQLTRRLRGLVDVQSREATVVARTAYNHVVTNVRIEMMQRNSNVFRGVIANAVLDGRTTKICISRSNGMWDLNTGRPLPGSPVRIPFPGPTPWHMGERTQLYPLTKSARQLGRNNQRVRQAIANLPPEQRALLNADPPISESYPDWLRRQPTAVQNEVLGPVRRKLWLDGKLSLRELVTQRGRTLTLKQLASRGIS